MFNVTECLSSAGYKQVTMKTGGVNRVVIVRDNKIKEPALKPVCIGGKPVQKGK